MRLNHGPRSDTKHYAVQALKLDGAELDGLDGARSSNMTPIYGPSRIASTAAAPVRTKRVRPNRHSPSETTTPRIAGDLRAGTSPFARTDFRPCQSLFGGLAVAWGTYGSRVAYLPPGCDGGPGGWPPITGTPRYTLTKFPVPQGTLGEQSSKPS